MARSTTALNCSAPPAAPNGFAALRALDTNSDGVIDAGDAAFSQLRVWVNPERDGVVHPGELLTLGQLGIVSINLNATASTEVIHGNAVRLVTSYTLSDGTTRTIGDAWFATSPTYTKPDSTPALSSDVAALPALSGYGALTDLRSAAMSDGTLKTEMQALVQNLGQDPSTTLAAITTILLEWSGFTTTDPNSRGGVFDARKLDFLEKYTGKPFYNASYNDDDTGAPASPRWRAAIDLEQAWNSAYNGATARLLLEAGYSLPEFTYNTVADFILPTISLQASLLSLFARLGDITASNAGQWELALRVADAFRLDAHLLATTYLATLADSVAAVASALIAGETFTVNANGTISLTGVTKDSTLYAGPAVRSIEIAGVASTTPPPLNDIIHYDQGNGLLDLTVTDYSDNPNTVLQFGPGITAAQVAVSADTTGKVYITDGVAGNQITVEGERNTRANGVHSVQFADGTVWLEQDLLVRATLGATGNTVRNGTTAANTLTGTSGADTFDGKGATGSAQDHEIGNGGYDIFIYNAGYGRLDVDETDFGFQPANVLKLGTGIAPGQVKVTGDSANGVHLGMSGNDQTTLDQELNGAPFGVQAVQFADGTLWTKAQLIALATTGTTGADSLYGSVDGDSLDGKGAPSGSQDYAKGNGGNDTFFFNAGYGRLEISELDFNATPANELRLGSGIAATQVKVTGHSLGNIHLSIGFNGDQATLDNELNGPSWGIQYVRLADGTVWNKTQLIALATTGTAGADLLYGTMEAETFDGKGAAAGTQDFADGYGGNDTFIFNAGYGQLEIAESDTAQTPANLLRLGAGITPGQVKVTGDAAGALHLTTGSNGDQVILDNELVDSSFGVQSVQFADGTIWGRAQLIALASTGTNAADTLYGSPDSENIDGKGAPTGAQDYANGGGGNDIFVFNQGYGKLEIDETDTASGPNNVLKLGSGIQHGDIRVTKSAHGSSVVVTTGQTGDQVTLDNMLLGTSFGVQGMQFVDGTSWTGKQLSSLAKTGSTGANTITGTTANDVFDGRGGTDTITGKGGYDTYLFRNGYGHLTINNAQTSGTTAKGELDFGAGVTRNNLWFANSNGDLTVTVLGSQDFVTIKGWFGGATSQLALFQGYDGMKLDTQVSGLMSAMAGYAGSHAGFNPATASQMPTDSALQGALTASWRA